MFGILVDFFVAYKWMVADFYWGILRWDTTNQCYMYERERTALAAELTNAPSWFHHSCNIRVKYNFVGS